MATKFGGDSLGKPAPRWYRRFERAFLLVFIPTGITILQSWGFKDQVTALKVQLLVSVGLTALIKGIGMMISNDEIYVDPTKNPDNNDPKTQ